MSDAGHAGSLRPRSRECSSSRQRSSRHPADPIGGRFRRGGGGLKSPPVKVRASLLASLPEWLASLSVPVASLSVLFASLPVLLAPSSVLAYEYSRPIEVTSIEDLFELYNTGEITDEELERLVALFETKVELNRAAADELYGLPDVTLDLARAIVAYREQVRPFKILDDVSVVPGMSREILDQIRAFARVRPVLEIKVPLTGTLSGKGAWNIEKPPAQINPEDPSGYDLGKSYVPAQLGLDRLPQAYLRFRGEAFNRARVGVVASSSEGIDAFVFEPATQVFQVTKWGRPLLRLEKGYVHLSERRWEAIAGNYMVGFGQRLVFDETSRPNPKGIYADDQVQTAYRFPGGAYSFDYPARLFGVAGTLKGLTLGPTSLEVTGFFSRRGYDLYQYCLLYTSPSPRD